MEKLKQPTKQSVRQCLHTEVGQRRPPPDPKQIRRELDWELGRVERNELKR